MCFVFTVILQNMQKTAVILYFIQRKKISLTLPITKYFNPKTKL